MAGIALFLLIFTICGAAIGKVSSRPLIGAVIALVLGVIIVFLVVTFKSFNCSMQAQAHETVAKYEWRVSKCLIKDGTRWVTPDNYGRAAN